MCTLSTLSSSSAGTQRPGDAPAPTALQDFAVAWGSVSGSQHRRLQRDNQDGVAVARTPELIIAAVADGCSAGRHSEVGARLCARWLCAWLPRVAPRVAALAGPEHMAELSAALVAFLRGWALALCPEPAALPGVVQDFCLATVLAVAIDEEHTAILGAGDGLYSLNGEVTVLEPAPGNRPAYLAYALLERAQLAGEPPPPELVLHRLQPTADVRSVLVATDGLLALRDDPERGLRDGTPAGGPSQFEGHARYLRNPSLVQKRLIQLAAVEGRLSDDATLALLRRRSAVRGGER